MSKLFDESINDKYVGAKHDKENSPFKDKIIISLKDPALQDEWLQIKAKKHAIKDESDYKSFVEALDEYFNKVCEKITAPGVDAFIDWIISLGFKRQNLLSLRDHLIENYQYSDYSNKVEFIQANGHFVDYDVNSSKIFNELIKFANKEIKDRVNKLIEKPDLYETTVLDFLKSVADELEIISEIEVLACTDISELFSEEQEENGIAFYQDIVKDAIAYLQHSQTMYPVIKGATASTVITNKIEDLTLFINSLDNFGLAKVTDEKVKVIFDKAKSQIIVGKEGTLKDHWTEFATKTWEELESHYTVIQDFFKEKNEISVGTLKSGSLKWNISSINTDLKHLIDKFTETIEKNPLEILSNYNTYKGLRDEFYKKTKAIDEVKLAASSLQTKLFELLDEKVTDFLENKIPIIDSIVDKKVNLQKDVRLIKDSVDALKKANTADYKEKTFLSFLSTDFDSFYEYFNSIDVMYTQLLSNAGMRENIDWLQQITGGAEELEITEVHLSEVEKLRELLKYNLVTISLTRNS